DRSGMRSIVALFLAAATAACASSSPSAPTENQAPASVVSAALNVMLSSFTSSFNTTMSSRRVGAARPQVLVFVQPPDQRGACAAGGYVSASSTMSGSVSNTTGEGTLTWQSYQTFVDCHVAADWALRSNPYESFGGTIGLFAGRSSLNIRVGGGG